MLISLITFTPFCVILSIFHLLPSQDWVFFEHRDVLYLSNHNECTFIHSIMNSHSFIHLQHLQRTYYVPGITSAHDLYEKAKKKKLFPMGQYTGSTLRIFQEECILKAQLFSHLFIGFLNASFQERQWLRCILNKHQKLASEDLAPSNDFASCTLNTSINTFKHFFLVFYKSKMLLAKQRLHHS